MDAAGVEYAGRLQALQADKNLYNRLKYFIHDLMVFGKDEGARLRLLQDPTANFYMSSVYFSPEQASALLSFQGREGVTLEQALQSTIARKLQQARDGSTTSFELCTSHDLAPVLQDYFGVSKAVLVEAANKGLYNKFAKEQREEQRKKPGKEQRKKPGKGQKQRNPKE
ncbi:hypothetical protein M758_1G191600 [Ceratodon purpureus]|nr:hypothetical protein M758_1G191600 [Ceratodon purpureus]